MRQYYVLLSFVFFIPNALFPAQSKSSTELEYAINRKNKPNPTPLMETLILSVIKDEIDINAQDESGQTALHFACQNGNLNLLEIILGKKPNLNIQDKNGKTALHLACQFHQIKTVETLLNAGANRSIADKKGRLPRDMAMFSNDWELIGIIISPRSKYSI